ncbi:MAG: hypothetical protein LBB76_00620 [Azoarcus sp.]|jgi:hypothetical protein|nr:hypothetical protein [Azoarcus sp.]
MWLDTNYMIDIPEYCAPVEELEAFIAKMKTLPQDDEGVQFAIRQAEFGLQLQRELKDIEPDLA